MKALHFHHQEDVTALWPEIQRDTARQQRRGGIGPWWVGKGPKHGGGKFGGAAGYGTFFVKSPRNQRVTAKAMVTKNRAPGAWYNHGLYLQREGANRAGAMGRGFDQQHEQIDLKTLLAQWQREGDRHLFKIVLSPENADTLDLKEFARRTMAAVEKDLGTPLQWAGIDHHNTKHAHVHVVLRGVSQGQQLNIARHYLRDGGIRERAQEVATRMLGPRSRQEIDQAAAQAVQRRQWSHLDQAITQKMDRQRYVSDGALTMRESERMEALAKRGLAWRDGSDWRMALEWGAQRMDERAQSRTPQREHEQEATTPEEQKKERTEREADEQHRRAVIVDEVEQEIGWGR